MNDTTKFTLAFALGLYIFISASQFCIGIIDGVSDPESCHFGRGARYIEYVFPAYTIGCYSTRVRK